MFSRKKPPKNLYYLFPVSKKGSRARYLRHLGWSLVVGIVVSAILGSGGVQSAMVKGDVPKGAGPPAEVVATHGSLVATVLSVTPVVRAGTPPTPAITSGSGIARVGPWIFVAQDDSTMLAARADDGRTDFLRLFPPVNGADRFLDTFNNKKAKPDLEAVDHRRDTKIDRKAAP